MSGQPNKKLRLESTSSSTCNFPFQSTITSTSRLNENIRNKCDNEDELWGEELRVDDNVMQEIESQALTQFQAMIHVVQPAPVQMQNDQFSQNARNYEKLEERLQTKQGEVTNLRMENERITKELRNHLRAKDETIENLKKQLSAKDCELEFQKAELKSQARKTPKTVKFQPNVNSSFHERIQLVDHMNLCRRFQFTQPKNLMKDGKVFNFGGYSNKGDLLYKLVQCAFDMNEANLSIRIEKGNGFTLFLNCCLLQLCRFAGFDKPAVHDLVSLMVTKSHEALSDLLTELSRTRLNVKQKLIVNRNSKSVVTLLKNEKNCDRATRKCNLLLLANAKWFVDEKAVAVRQAIAMLAKLMQVEEPLSIRILDRSNNHPREDSRIFDVIELLENIVDEISFQKESNLYEGVYCSILYFCCTLSLCSLRGFAVPDNKYKISLANLFKRILFSLPGSVAIRYVMNFLDCSVRFCLSDYLCHRSAADTFSENFSSFCFSYDTCTLQVLCARMEMSDKSPYFVDKLTRWLVKMVTAFPRHVRWMKNQTDSKLCECLPTLEQMTVKTLLHCVEHVRQKNHTFRDKVSLDSSTKRCWCIIKHLKWQDDQFNLHTANCLIEYEILLRRLTEVSNDKLDEKFALKEMEILHCGNRFPVSWNAATENLIASVLQFSPIVVG